MNRFIFGFQRRGLVPEVHAALEQLSHGDDGHDRAPCHDASAGHGPGVGPVVAPAVAGALSPAR
jgi:hypothetical protein